MFAMEGVKVPPENWTISCAVSEVCVLPIVFGIIGMAPAQAHFANHTSVQQHEDVGEKELEKARTAGVIVLADWPFE